MFICKHSSKNAPTISHVVQKFIFIPAGQIRTQDFEFADAHVTITPWAQHEFHGSQPDINFSDILAWAIWVIKRSQELEMMLHNIYHGNSEGRDPLQGRQQNWNCLLGSLPNKDERKSKREWAGARVSNSESESEQQREWAGAGERRSGSENERERGQASASKSERERATDQRTKRGVESRARDSKTEKNNERRKKKREN